MQTFSLSFIDSSDLNAEYQYKTVLKVLDEIGADKKKRIIVLNKIDSVSSGDWTQTDLNIAHLNELFPDAVKVSAKTREGFDELYEAIHSKLNEKQVKKEDEPLTGFSFKPWK